MFPTKILLATNGSLEASLAEEAAVELANGTGSELHVVSVVKTTPELPYPRSSMRERSEAMLERRKMGSRYPNGISVRQDLRRKSMVSREARYPYPACLTDPSGLRRR